MSGVTADLERDGELLRGILYVPEHMSFGVLVIEMASILLGGHAVKTWGNEQQGCIPAAMTCYDLPSGLQIYITFVETITHGLGANAQSIEAGAEERLNQGGAPEMS